MCASVTLQQGTLDSSHIQRYDASVERGLWSIGEAVLQVHSMVAQGGSSKSLHVAVEFFPLMRDCMLVPLPQVILSVNFGCFVVLIYQDMTERMLKCLKQNICL